MRAGFGEKILTFARALSQDERDYLLWQIGQRYKSGLSIDLSIEEMRRILSERPK